MDSAPAKCTTKMHAEVIYKWDRFEMTVNGNQENRLRS